MHSVVRDGGGVRIATSQGEIDARIAVITAGPWLKTLMPELPVALRVTREVMAWFTPLDPAPFARDHFPVFLLDSPHGMHYGFPLTTRGTLKVAKHHHRDETADPDDVRREVTATDEAQIRPVLADHLPLANGPLAAAKTCLYTVTPDHHFIIDRLPGAPQIIVASPCSGHGFKFAPVIGEILADLALEGGTAHDIRRFRMSRFR